MSTASTRTRNNKRKACKAALDADYKQSITKKQKVHIPVFVQKLHHMLSSPNAKDIQTIVAWNDNDNGQTFIVKNCQLFSQRVIPKYFDCTLSSFKRQLNYYGFVRVVDDDVNQLESSATKKKKKGKNKSRAMKYRHERNKFQRNRPDMLYEIRRSTCNDPKVELDYLRDKVNSLEDECTDLKKELKDVKAQMHSWIQVMQHHQQNQTTSNLGAPISSANNNANQLRVQQRTASITIDLNSSSQVPLPRSKSIGIGCEAVRMKSTESTTGLAVQENDWELFQKAMFMGSQGSCGLNLAKPSADRTISDPGLLDELLNAGGKLERDEDGESDNDDDSSYEETVPV